MSTPPTARRFAGATHACAMQMAANAVYIQKQLPALDLPDPFRSQIGPLCQELIGTKNDLNRVSPLEFTS